MPRSTESLRRKRLRRNKKKRESFKNLSRKERKEWYFRASNGTIAELNDKLKLVEKKLKTSSYPMSKNLERRNLCEIESQPFLGKGAFGECSKMNYRGITVAVKTYNDWVTIHSVRCEADIVRKFDHPGLPLLFGVCLEQKPYMMVTQFHGISGKCATFKSALKSSIVAVSSEWVKLFIELAEALIYVHGKGVLHNDVKGDNVLLSSQTTDSGTDLHAVLIDFGKCRSVKNPKKYMLDAQEQAKYKKYHCHIAPELIDGTRYQSSQSDIYSFGLLLSMTCKVKTVHEDREFISDISIACMRRNPEDRPTMCQILRKLEGNLH